MLILGQSTNFERLLNLKAIFRNRHSDFKYLIKIYYNNNDARRYAVVFINLFNTLTI